MERRNNKILIIEDELAISEVLKAYFVKAQFEVKQVFHGADAIQVFQTFQPDVVLLDVMLPGRDGWSILQDLRAAGECPVLMLTALSDVQFRLEAFSDGADDYIPKPFHGEEVVARVKAVLKRMRGSSPSQTTDRSFSEGGQMADEVTFGCLRINFTGYFVYIHDEQVEFTPRDLSLLLFLAKHPNQTFTRDQLLEHVWGWEYDGSDRAVDLSIKRLRKGLAGWLGVDGEIRTLRGVGYQLYVYEK